VPEYSHRSDRFKGLYKDLKDTFRDKFSIDSDYEIIFVTGSGTLANEIVISSFKYVFKVANPFSYIDDLENNKCKFADRLLDMVVWHRKRNSYSRCLAAVLYETSVCKFVNNSIINSVHDYLYCFYDCVSSFPYYDLLPNTDCFTTVSGKQLGCEPGVAVICIKKDRYVQFVDAGWESYLSLNWHYQSSKKNETAFTPAIGLFEKFYEGLKKFDLVEHRSIINNRYKLLKETAMCEGDPPVVLFRNMPSWIAEKYNLYKGTNGYQAFLWCGTDKQYKDFAKDLKQCQ